MRYPVIFFLFILVAFSSCKKRHHNVTRGIYYWKTIYKPTASELATLRKLQVQKIYLRLFDVDQDEKLRHAIPVAPIRVSAVDSGFAYVPVVFITQKAIIALKDKDISQFAENICSFAKFLCEQVHINSAEMQIDCDWTAGTKETYFALLRAIKQNPFMRNKLLSCTIRLNQVKYTARNGIPPADKGLVMCYGMGNLKKYGPYNSVLDADEAKDYLKHMDTYPLPLDIALPVFEWCALFRDKHYIGILHEVAGDDVVASGLFKHLEGNMYSCPHDTLWHGYKLQANDVIRLEKPAHSDINTVAKYSSQQIINTDLNVILFDCDSITLSKFSNDELETIYTGYR